MNSGNEPKELAPTTLDSGTSSTIELELGNQGIAMDFDEEGSILTESSATLLTELLGDETMTVLGGDLVSTAEGHEALMMIPEETPLKLTRSPYIFGLLASLITFAYGFGVGSTTVLLIAIPESQTIGIVAVMLCGAIIGSAISAFGTQNSLGRLGMLRLNALFLLSGSLLTVLAGFHASNPSDSHVFWVIVWLVARMLVGFGAGMASCLPALYITEMSPASIRGFLGLLSFGFGVFGQFASWFIGWLLLLLVSMNSSPPGVFLICGISFISTLLAALGLVATFFIPESPRWLVSRGLHDEALKALAKIYGPANEHHFTQEFARIYARLSRPFYDLNATPPLRLHLKDLVLIVVLQVVQQLAANSFITYFSASIFRSWGLSKQTALLATAISALPQLIVYGGVAGLAERIGRRRLLLFSEALMVLNLVYLGMICRSKHTHAAIFIFIGITAHRMVYALGLASVPTVLISESLPFHRRAQGLAFAQTFTWVLSFLSTTLIAEMAATRLSEIYFTLATASAFGLFFIYRFISETKGLRLEAVDEMRNFPVIPAGDQVVPRDQITCTLYGTKPLKPPPIPVLGRQK